MVPLLILIYKLKEGRSLSQAESQPRCGAPQFLSNMHTVIGRSMSKGVKKDEQNLHRLVLAVAFNYIN